MDKKILKEWNKIKEHNVLKDINELENLFKMNPNGMCLRKYTVYPWSKENFFFGTAQDLLDWYKTTDEIPFFTKNYINKKFGHLTISNFERDKENNNELIAICQCQCGNEAKLNFRKVRHGDYVSCGCKARKQKFISLYDSFKKIIDEKWDYNKNLEDPKQIPFDTENEYWWKGYNHSYLMSPKTFFVKSKGTSFPEQAMLYFLKQHFEDVENRYKVEIDGKKYEADIYLKNLKVAIEYDGYIWHKSKYDEDIDKTRKFSSQNIFVIRIRESGLRDIIENNCVNIKCDIENMSYLESLSQAINNTIKLIGRKFKVKLNLEEITAETIKNKKTIIESQYLIGYEKDNIENSVLYNLWSDKNHIEKHKVSIHSHDKFYFKCNNNYDLFISPITIINIVKKCDEKGIFKFGENRLIENECPFLKMKECPCNAFYHEKIEKPCQYFKEYSKVASVKVVNPIENIWVYANKNALLTEFEVLFNKYNKFINSLQNQFNIKDLEVLRNFIQNLLFYKTNKSEKIFDNFITLNISNELKLKYLENIIIYPYLPMNDIARCFNSKPLLEFYFHNSDFNKIKETQEPLLLNYLHSCYVVDVLKILIYEHKLEALRYSLKILHENISQSLYDKIITSIIVSIITKENYRYKELKETISIFNEVVEILNDKDLTENNFEFLFNLSLLNLREKYLIPLLKYKLKNSVDKEYLIWLYRYFGKDTKMFFDVINHEISLGNQNLQKIFEDELMFSKRFFKDSLVRCFDFENKFNEQYIPNLIYYNDELSEKDIYGLINQYIEFFGYGNIDIRELKNPKMVLKILKKYGFSRVKFNVEVFDNKYKSLLFDFIIDIYDKKINNSERLISTRDMLNLFKDGISRKFLSYGFLEQCKKTISYIQERNKRNSNSYIWVNDIDDFNELIGIRKKLR